MQRTATAVAILDVDGTLYPRSIGLALLAEMARRGLGRADEIAAVTAHVTRFRRAEIDFPEMVRCSTAAYAAALTGVRQAELEGLARETWAEIRCDLFAFVRPLIARLGRAGVTPYIVSSSPHEIVTLLASDLGVPACDGSRFAAAAGRYTGECLAMPGAPGGKLTLFRRFATACNADLSRSIALGNGEGDLEVLEATGHPLVFEPGEPLVTIAARRGWPQVDRHNILAQLERSLGA